MVEIQLVDGRCAQSHDIAQVSDAGKAKFVRHWPAEATHRNTIGVQQVWVRINDQPA
jgi:hypothetical protein